MKRVSLLYSIPLVLLALLIPTTSSRRIVQTPPLESLRCAIPRQDAEFHRSLVNKYAQDENLDIGIILAEGLSLIDSLRAGSMDLIVIQDPEDSLIDGISVSRAFADGSVWCVREDEVEALMHINRWITELTASERFNRMQKRYFSGKPVSITAISQYDRLLRASADSTGLDWRMLAAVVYHESRFHSDANSAKGAMGLMQIRSRKYSDEMLRNPASNISVGSRYLSSLIKRYEKDSADYMEAVKFALAAYNYGEGKLANMREETKAAGEDPTRWDSVKMLLPEGHHTRSYVENVLNTYAYYSKLYPR